MISARSDATNCLRILHLFGGCDEVLLVCIMTNKLKTVRHGKFQHPAIISGVGKFYFSRGRQNAIGNLKPYNDVIALRDNLSGQSVIWICLGVYIALVYF
jgi:hypothetical protein